MIMIGENAMKRTVLTSVIGLTFALLTACSETASESTPTLRTGQSKNGSVGNSLRIKWGPQTDATAYHVYYVDANAKGREIDSLQRGSTNFANPVMTIDSSNMEAWPAKGSKACFYVVADNAGLLSEPSDKACITL